MLYVPASSVTRLRGRGKRTRFTPGRPLTAKRLTRRQTGESCSTTKAIRVGRESLNVRTVVRRRFGPFVLIQLRDVWPRVTLSPEGSPPGGPGAATRWEAVPGVALLPGCTADWLALPDPVDAGPAVVVAGTAAGEVVCTVGAGNDGVLVTGGGGGGGAGGGGTGTDGKDEVTERIDVTDVMDGTVGTGRPSASARPVRRPAPSRVANAAARRIPPQLRTARFGCGV